MEIVELLLWDTGNVIHIAEIQQILEELLFPMTEHAEV